MIKWIVYVVTRGLSIVISLLTSGLVLIKRVYSVTGTCKIIYTVNVLNIKDLSNISEKQRQKRQPTNRFYMVWQRAYIHGSEKRKSSPSESKRFTMTLYCLQ